MSGHCFVLNVFGLLSVFICTVGAKSLSPVIFSWQKMEKCMSFIKRMQLSA